MVYVYHMVPKNMKGNILYPLNVLKKKYPLVYKEHIKKYENRMNLLKKNIPILNCLWNDVLHFTPIHPSKISKELKKAGFSYRKSKWYKINSRLLNQNNTIIYFYKYGEENKDYILFDEKKVKSLRNIPLETINYYKECFKEKRHPLLFYKVPHVLYKGNINIEDVEIIYC